MGGHTVNRYRVTIEQQSTRQTIVRIVEADTLPDALVAGEGIADALSSEHGSEFDVINVKPD